MPVIVGLLIVNADPLEPLVELFRQISNRRIKEFVGVMAAAGTVNVKVA